MQATHVRFALEFEKELGIVNRAKYLSGVVYPDSRYMCGIDRCLTHDPNLQIADVFLGTDFEKGWKMHVVYDILQRDHILGLFNINKRIVGYSDDWFTVSSAKFVEDLESYKLLNKSKVMESICPTIAPYNENSAKLSKWYDMQRSVYFAGRPCLDSYMPIINWFEGDCPGSKEKILGLIKDQTENKELVGRIYAMYGKIVKEFYDGLESR